MYLNSATDGATHRGGDPRISISFKHSIQPLGVMNRYMVFESLSGVSAVFTTNLPIDLLDLLREAIQSNQFGLSTCIRDHSLQLSIDICILQANVFAV